MPHILVTELAVPDHQPGCPTPSPSASVAGLQGTPPCSKAAQALGILAQRGMPTQQGAGFSVLCVAQIQGTLAVLYKGLIVGQPALHSGMAMQDIKLHKRPDKAMLLTPGAERHTGRMVPQFPAWQALGPGSCPLKLGQAGRAALAAGRPPRKLQAGP